MSLTLLWALPLGFSFFNGSLVALLFPCMPETMVMLIRQIDTYRLARLLARTMVILPWFLAGWWIVLRYFKTMALSKATKGETAPWK
jgi:hypothetical protein